jgi:hypothetical protein
MESILNTIEELAKKDNVVIDDKTMTFIVKFLQHSFAGRLMNLRGCIKDEERFLKFGDIARRDADYIRDFLVQLNKEIDNK